MSNSPMTNYGPPEKVYVENEWYDGPRAGIADINGMPHRFMSLFDKEEDDYNGIFMVWPVDEQVLDLEIEQWCIFVEWNTLFESGQVDTDSHPGHGSRNARWDEIEALLKQRRSDMPAWAKRARAQMCRIDRDERYTQSGPDYMLKWSIL